MPDNIKISLNPDFNGEKRDVIERYFSHLIDPNFTESARDIKRSILEKAGKLGVCSGLLTAGWMNMERMSERPILIHIRTDHNRPERKVKNAQEGKLFAGFAVLQFKKESTGTYLYVDGLCSNLGKAGALMDFIMNDLGKKLLDTGLIQGFKLSALGYVIGYYYKKYGFKFYKKDNNKLVKDTLVNNALKEKFSKYVYNPDDEYDVVDDFTGNWSDKLDELLTNSELKTMVTRSVLKKLTQLNKELMKLREAKKSGSLKDRRETLTKRMEIVREMQKIINAEDKTIRKYVERGFSPIYEFYLIAREHSAENVHILTRGRSDSKIAQQLEEQGISDEGFYMYKLPDSDASRPKSPFKKKRRGYKGKSHKRRRTKKKRKRRRTKKRRDYMGKSTRKKRRKTKRR